MKRMEFTEPDSGGSVMREIVLAGLVARGFRQLWECDEEALLVSDAYGIAIVTNEQVLMGQVRDRHLDDPLNLLTIHSGRQVLLRYLGFIMLADDGHDADEVDQSLWERGKLLVLINQDGDNLIGSGRSLWREIAETPQYYTEAVYASVEAAARK